MNISEIMNKKKEYEALLSEMGEKALKDEFKKFFDANPTVDALRWTQYTPYFNDGDPCTFRMGDWTYRNAGDEDGDEDLEDGFQYVPYGKHPINEALSSIDAVDNDVFQMVFGDHVEITATRDGFTVDEYHHD